MRWRISLALLCLGLATPAFAEDAAALKAEGDRLMDTFRYEDALGKYDAAYKLKADPALLYNQGRALEGLGRFPDALDKLLDFQAKAPKDLLARLGEALEKNIGELRGRIAILTVVVDPPGSVVRLGDRVLGEAPLTKLRVNAGKVHFEFAKEGFFTETLDVALEGGKETPVEIKLSPRDSRATLKVTSAVAGASVVVNGTPRGQVPLELKLAPGPHLVRLEQDDFYDSESVVELAPLEQKTFSVELDSIPVTARWWFWTLLGTGVAGGAVATTLALTLERPADTGSLNPGQILVSGTESRSAWAAGAVPSFSQRALVFASPVIPF
jgi:hypothetical protein